MPNSKVNRFEYWYDFLNRAKINSYQKYNELMSQKIEIRKQKGKLIEGVFNCDGKIMDNWKYNVELSENNRSDFRDRDLVLIMEKENYYSGAAKVGQIHFLFNGKSTMGKSFIILCKK